LVRAALLTLSQLSDPVFRRVAIKSVTLTVCLFTGLAVIFYFARPNVTYFGWDWLNSALDIGGSILSFALLILAFSTIATSISSIFLDEIANAVEERHYRNDPPGQSTRFLETLPTSVRFIGVALLLNILALPFYLIALFIPPLFAFIFYGLNGYLLSREYFELVSLRHQDAKSAQRLRKTNRMKIFFAGVVIALFITVPVVNLFVPILATVFMLHIFKAMQNSMPN